MQPSIIIIIPAEGVTAAFQDGPQHLDRVKIGTVGGHPGNTFTCWCSQSIVCRDVWLAAPSCMRSQRNSPCRRFISCTTPDSKRLWMYASESTVPRQITKRDLNPIPIYPFRHWHAGRNLPFSALARGPRGPLFERNFDQKV